MTFQDLTNKAYICTVQIVISPFAGARTESEAAGWIKAFIEENESSADVLDWAYLKVGGQRLCPAEIDVRRGEDGVLIAYQAGEAFQP